MRARISLFRLGDSRRVPRLGRHRSRLGAARSSRRLRQTSAAPEEIGTATRLSVPTHHRLWLDEDEHAPLAGPEPGQRDPEVSIEGREARPRVPVRVGRELLSERELNNGLIPWCARTRSNAFCHENDGSSAATDRVLSRVACLHAPSSAAVLARDALASHASLASGVNGSADFSITTTAKQREKGDDSVLGHDDGWTEALASAAAMLDDDLALRRKRSKWRAWR